MDDEDLIDDADEDYITGDDPEDLDDDDDDDDGLDEPQFIIFS